MGVNLGDIFKEHKKIILGMAGIIVMVIILSVVSSGSGFFGISDNMTNGGVDDLLDGGNSNKSYSSAPSMQIDTEKNYYAILNTDYGQIDIDLYEKDTPNTVNNFVFLANDNFYDNLTFHRIVKDFVIQGGDPSGTGEGGPGYTFADEIDADALGLNNAKVGETVYLRYFYTSEDINKNANKSVKQFYELLGYHYTSGKGTHKFEPYVLAMANSGPNTNGSQFFITTKGFNGEYLNGKHTVFGKVVSGFDVIDKIESVNVGLNDKPTAAVHIKDVQIITK